MNSKVKLTAVGACAALCTLFAGCDPTGSVSEAEARERASRLYSNAMDDLQAGRMDAAIVGFEKVIRGEPRAYSAHFQLATLLQDSKQDYIGAIAHYREYLALRPSSDKATVAQDRARLCETLLANQLAQKAGPVAGDKLAADNEKLDSERKELAARIDELSAQLAALQSTNDALKAENVSFRRILQKVGSEEGDSSVAASITPPKLNSDKNFPTDSELINGTDKVVVDDRIKNSSDVKNLRLEAERELAADRGTTKSQHIASTNKAVSAEQVFGGGTRKKKAVIKRPATYVIQPGDTLFSLAMKFYGTSSAWRRIRSANKATISTDGRVRVGQTIKLP